MTDLHYEFTGETKVNWAGVTLHRIRATRDMPRFVVSAGEEGGWVEDTKNLSGDAWVFGDAEVFGDAWVFGAARVFGDARVFGAARVSGDAEVYGDAEVFGDAWVFGAARVYGDARVYGAARVSGHADYMHLTTYTSQRLITTLFKEKNGKHTIKMGCWSGTVEELEDLFKRDKWVETSGAAANEAREEMLALCQVFRARIARWDNDPES